MSDYCLSEILKLKHSVRI